MKNHKQDSYSPNSYSNEHEPHEESLKDGKKKRKLAQARDRSKFKKTDIKKYTKSINDNLNAKLINQNLLEGRVLSIMPQGIVVDHKEELIYCTLKGLLKKEKTEAKNLVAVGDFVLFQKIGDKEGIISHIKPRHSFLSRADNLSRRKEQLIAVNIDQVIITVSVVNPPLKVPIIDRYIIASKKGGMEPIIVINKIDLFSNKENLFRTEVIEAEKIYFDEVLKAYAAAGITLIFISATEKTGMEQLKEVMSGKTSVFSGPSGVGKSSLINAVTGLDLRTGEIVEKTKKGSHTTTTTQLIPLDFGGWCIDTPGIKSFGVWNLDPQEIQNYFPEIQRISELCHYADCTHIHEEQCAVLSALTEGKLSPLRFDSYQALMYSVKAEHIRR